MEIPIKVNNSNLTTACVEVLNPVLKLTRREKEILSEYLELFKLYPKDPKLLNNTDIKKSIRNKIKISEPSFNNYMKQLRDKKIFTEGGINPTLTSLVLSQGNKEIKYNIVVVSG